jgi:hypothetical protein
VKTLQALFIYHHGVHMKIAKEVKTVKRVKKIEATAATPLVMTKAWPFKGKGIQVAPKVKKVKKVAVKPTAVVKALPRRSKVIKETNYSDMGRLPRQPMVVPHPVMWKCRFCTHHPKMHANDKALHIFTYHKNEIERQL